MTRVRRYECRRKGCDDLTSDPGGLCDWHMAPPDMDLIDKEERSATRFETFEWFEDDHAPMSSQEKYLHPENE